MTTEAQVTPCLEYWLRFLKESGIDAELIGIWWNYGDDTDECLCMEYDSGEDPGRISWLELRLSPDGMIEYSIEIFGVNEWGFIHIDDWYLTTLKRITRMFPLKNQR